MFSKKLIREYFAFGKRDRLGIIALVILILFIYLLPTLFSKQPDDLAVKDLGLPGHFTDSLPQPIAKENHSEKEVSASNFNPHPAHSNFTENDFTKGELFNFDPNTLPAREWQRMGLSEKISRTIENYRNKGGRFYKPDDLNKIWGLPPGFFERIKNYIRIETAKHSELKSGPVSGGKSVKKPLLLDINQSDSATWVLLPGIGPRLAARIVGFREKLGGFYDLGQIAETYGLPDSTFQKIKTSLTIGNFQVRQMSINKSTRDELRTHPYLKWSLANAIVEYRNQHGDYQRLEDLKKIALITESVFYKISPYLSL